MQLTANGGFVTAQAHEIEEFRPAKHPLLKPRLLHRAFFKVLENIIAFKQDLTCVTDSADYVSSQVVIKKCSTRRRANLEEFRFGEVEC